MIMERYNRLLLMFLFHCYCTGQCKAFLDELQMTCPIPVSIEQEPFDPNISLDEKIRNALLIAEMNLVNRKAGEPIPLDIPENCYTVDAFYVARKLKENSPRSTKLYLLQLIFEEVTKILKLKYNIDPTQLPSKEYLLGTAMANYVKDCIKGTTVTNRKFDEKYRTFDGSYNNLNYPTWGMASSCFQRLLPPVYSDGIFELRKATSGKDLPNARRMSVAVHGFKNSPDPINTRMFGSYGQFLTHDMTASPWPINRNVIMNCCAQPVFGVSRLECIPVTIDSDDPFYPAQGVTCLNAPRTTSCPSCGLGARQQMVQVTSFIDGSQIYGLTAEENDKLRNKDGSGTLKSNLLDPSNELLPPSQHETKDACSFQAYDRSKICFEAGDSRVNQHTFLTSLHILFLRQHNRLARLFKTIYPSWNEEKLFQETRRVVIAQLQVITYSEYLPQLLGPFRDRSLFIQPTLSYTQYDPTINPTMLEEFSTAAFRFGHSMTGNDRLIDPAREIRLSFNRPFDNYNRTAMNKMFIDMAKLPAQTFDRYVNADLTNHLYVIHGQPYGLDLVMLDIFRGRDHGLPPYVKMLKFCGGPDIVSFLDLNQIFREGYVEVFKEQYESVQDIDLFSGGLAEEPTNGAVVGPTFACIIETQFQRTKFGDRFYFEHGQQAGSFTTDQLREIKKTTFAKIICQNIGIDKIHQHVFDNPANPGNFNYLCDELPDLDLRVWPQ